MLKSKLDAGTLVPSDIVPNTVVVVGTRMAPEGYGHSGSAACMWKWTVR